MARKLSQKIGQGLLSSKDKDQKSSGDSGSDSKQGSRKSDSEVKVNKSKTESGSKSDPGNKTEHRNKTDSRKKSHSGKGDSHDNTNERLGFHTKKQADSIAPTTDNIDSSEQISRTSSSCDIVKREKTQSPSVVENHSKSSEKRRRSRDDQDRDRRHKRKKHKRKDASEYGYDNILPLVILCECLGR